MQRLLGVALLIAVCGCAPSSQTTVYRAPADFVGKEVTVCGLIHYAFEDQNIWPSRREQRRAGVGLGITFADDTDDWGKSFDRRRACVKGTIERTGCAEELICTQTSYQYGVLVTDRRRGS